MQSENLVILLDLNCYHWIKYQKTYRGKVDEARKKNALCQMLSFEEIIDSVCNIIITHCCMNNQNRAILFVYDETQTKKVFPVDEVFEAYLKMLNFVEVRKHIIAAVDREMINKELSFNHHSQLIKALSKAICSSRRFTQPCTSSS